MQSHVPSVAQYLKELPEDRQQVLNMLRRLCRERLVGYKEGMDYGMPVNKRDGTVEVAFASQRQYVSLYVLKKGIVDRHRSKLKSCKIGKGCIRFPRPEKIDFEQISTLLGDVAQSREDPC